MDDLDRAILCCFDQNASTQLKNSALQFCTQVKEANRDVWRVCLEKLLKIGGIAYQRTEIRFWCLQTLAEFINKRHEVLSSEDQLMLRAGLLNWIKDICATQNLEPYTKNKFSQVYVQLVKQEYPKLWSSAFKDLLLLLNLGVNVIDLFLRILQVLDEEVVNRSVQRTKEEHIRHIEIKDYMRLDCIPAIVSAWFTILKSGHTELTLFCLKIMPNYIDWIDIGLVTSEEFANLFFSLFSIEKFREGVSDCLTTIVCKGMDQKSKLSLIIKLQLPQLIQSVKLESLNEDDTFALNFSSLAQAVACALLEMCKQIYQPFKASSKNAVKKENNLDTQQMIQAGQILETLLPILVTLLGDENDEVSSNVLAFFDQYISLFKVKEVFDSRSQQLIAILEIIRTKCRYTDEFEFDVSKQSEYEASLLEYRRDLTTLFKNICRISSELAKNFIYQLVINTLQNAQQLNFMDVEVALFLFFQMGEILSEEYNNVSNSKDKFYAPLTISIVKSNIVSYQHMSVQISYFEIVTRYAKVFLHEQDLIPPVLQAFMDERGIRSSNRSVSSRASYLFSRFVKVVTPSLYLYVDKLYEYTKSFLQFNTPQNASDLVSTTDKMFIYESLGSIIANEKVSQETRAIITESLLKPIVAQMEEILNKELYKLDTPENPLFATILASLISAAGCLSKGFTQKTSTSQVVPLFQLVLQTVFKVFFALPANKTIREKLSFYLHRMVELLDDDSLLSLIPSTFGQLIQTTDDAQSVKDVIILLNQCIARLKTRLSSFIVEIIPIIYSKVNIIINNGTYVDTIKGESISEEQRIQIDIHKSYFTIYFTLLRYDCQSVLTNTIISQKLNEILDSVIKNCYHPSIHMMKLCFSILVLMVQIWSGDKNTSLSGFTNFVYSQIIPVCFNVAITSPFLDFEQASTGNLLFEIVNILKAAYENCKLEFLQVLQTFLIQQLQLQPNDAQLFCSQIQSFKDSDLKTSLELLVKAKRKLL